MRQILIALLSFITGVALTLSVRCHSPVERPVTSIAAATSSSTALPAPASSVAQATETYDSWPDEAPTPEQVFYAQPALLQQAFEALTPRVPGQPNLYIVAFAGDGSQNVFRNEAEYAAKLFAQRFGPTTHTLVLENNPASLGDHPLASWSNLEASLDQLTRVMHPDQDILLLYLATHGSEDHTLLVDMDPLPLDQIDADNLAGIIKPRPFKWKVIVVNACYSGGFIPPLRSPGTLILTAARSDRSSFGCGNESDLTYFGHAWLVNALNHTDNFVDAFKQARHEIAGWEKQDKLTPSEPQIDVGRGIENRLELWRSALKPGAPVPFAPASSSVGQPPASH